MGRHDKFFHVTNLGMIFVRAKINIYTSYLHRQAEWLYVVFIFGATIFACYLKWVLIISELEIILVHINGPTRFANTTFKKFDRLNLRGKICSYIHKKRWPFLVIHTMAFSIKHELCKYSSIVSFHCISNVHLLCIFTRCVNDKLLLTHWDKWESQQWRQN